MTVLNETCLFFHEPVMSQVMHACSRPATYKFTQRDHAGKSCLMMCIPMHTRYDRGLTPNRDVEFRKWASCRQPSAS